MNFLNSIWRAVWRTITDAIFPLSPAEEAVMSMSPEDALTTLPPAPAFDASVADLPGTRAVFAYKDERVSRLIWCIKYKRSGPAIKIGALVLFKNLPTERCIIIPTPITKRRRRERGYNQCELLLSAMAELDVQKIHTYEPNLLIRVQHKNRQTLKGRSDRLESSHGIFAVNPTKAYDLNTPIIIIDDVITTGSTMKEAVDTLRAAGFSDVRGLSLAH